eukprot:TRINITY_DN19057_c0_g1_i1.p1 TRINITY_DN19057_c0_g1~~TRINITY_DN19057_c0_g1_i1.p1  ORF type:complete len:1621 (-),score=545.35 TRINITY_DN19057_c0_g1_i1:115-4977(-)
MVPQALTLLLLLLLAASSEALRLDEDELELQEPQPVEEPFKISVRDDDDGTSIDLKVDGSDSLGEVIGQLQAALDVHGDQVFLVFNGKELTARSAKLSSLGLREGSRLELVAGPHYGPSEGPARRRSRRREPWDGSTRRRSDLHHDNPETKDTNNDLEEDQDSLQEAGAAAGNASANTAGGDGSHGNVSATNGSIFSDKPILSTSPRRRARRRQQSPSSDAGRRRADQHDHRPDSNYPSAIQVEGRPKPDVVSLSPKANTFQIGVRLPGPDVVELTAQTTNTVGQLKGQLAYKYHLKPAQFSIYQGATKLEDDKTLREYHIYDEPNLPLIVNFPAETAPPGPAGRDQAFRRRRSRRRDQHDGTVRRRSVIHDHEGEDDNSAAWAPPDQSDPWGNIAQRKSLEEEDEAPKPKPAGQKRTSPTKKTKDGKFRWSSKDLQRRRARRRTGPGDYSPHPSPCVDDDWDEQFSAWEEDVRRQRELDDKRAAMAKKGSAGLLEKKKQDATRPDAVANVTVAKIESQERPPEDVPGDDELANVSGSVSGNISAVKARRVQQQTQEVQQASALKHAVQAPGAHRRRSSKALTSPTLQMAAKKKKPRWSSKDFQRRRARRRTGPGDDSPLPAPCVEDDWDEQFGSSRRKEKSAASLLELQAESSQAGVPQEGGDDTPAMRSHLKLKQKAESEEELATENQMKLKSEIAISQKAVQEALEQVDEADVREAQAERRESWQRAQERIAQHNIRVAQMKERNADQKDDEKQEQAAQVAGRTAEQERQEAATRAKELQARAEQQNVAKSKAEVDATVKAQELASHKAGLVEARRTEYKAGAQVAREDIYYDEATKDQVEDRLREAEEKVMKRTDEQGAAREKAIKAARAVAVSARQVADARQDAEDKAALERATAREAANPRLDYWGRHVAYYKRAKALEASEAAQEALRKANMEQDRLKSVAAAASASKERIHALLLQDEAAEDSAEGEEAHAAREVDIAKKAAAIEGVDTNRDEQHNADSELAHARRNVDHLDDAIRTAYKATYKSDRAHLLALDAHRRAMREVADTHTAEARRVALHREAKTADQEWEVEDDSDRDFRRLKRLQESRDELHTNMRLAIGEAREAKKGLRLEQAKQAKEELAEASNLARRSDELDDHQEQLVTDMLAKLDDEQKAKGATGADDVKAFAADKRRQTEAFKAAAFQAKLIQGQGKMGKEHTRVTKQALEQARAAETEAKRDVEEFAADEAQHREEASDASAEDTRALALEASEDLAVRASKQKMLSEVQAQFGEARAEIEQDMNAAVGTEKEAARALPGVREQLATHRKEMGAAEQALDALREKVKCKANLGSELSKAKDKVDEADLKVKTDAAKVKQLELQIASSKALKERMYESYHKRRLDQAREEQRMARSWNYWDSRKATKAKELQQLFYERYEKAKRDQLEAQDAKAVLQPEVRDSSRGLAFSELKDRQLSGGEELNFQSSEPEAKLPLRQLARTAAASAREAANAAEKREVADITERRYEKQAFKASFYNQARRDDEHQELKAMLEERSAELALKRGAEKVELATVDKVDLDHDADADSGKEEAGAEASKSAKGGARAGARALARRKAGGRANARGKLRKGAERKPARR